MQIDLNILIDKLNAMDDEYTLENVRDGYSRWESASYVIDHLIDWAGRIEQEQQKEEKENG
jgi:hypothetical protein